ncbi:glycoside hydrolase family 3 protein [Flagellimonas onchidii]|uniref:glycoside hydrolase family 3 protein n=1 Tax=Flagellimonas onchidii TaxID=2562684 RepID=UPI00197AD471|nr:glycoside hydrolase family 3 protein [Allomuricauda onchidii]
MKEKIGQMIMVGFRGISVTEKDAIFKMVNDYHISGVVLYSRDLPSKEHVKRNVLSPTQLKKLNQNLQAIDSTELLISIDEEGGFVTRLTLADGFENHASHQAIGDLDNIDSTRIWAQNMAHELSELGINMNYAPVIDLNINPENPIIGKRERSFSDDEESVLSNSRIFIQEHQNQGIICVPKHFPGHGSSDKDSHKGLADVTHTWSKKELIPFQELIKDGSLDVIMTSHVYNENLDTLPSTLSPKIINNMLRNDFGFEGVIISDDMQMRAISNFYDFETSIEKAIIAGVDILLFSNNAAPCPEGSNENCVEIPFDSEIAKKAIDHILSLVNKGHISKERIEQSYQRIKKLKKQL